MILLAVGLAALRASRCREFHCKGLTTCVDNTCQTFLRGDPCQVDTRDVELHFDFYYSKEIEVTTTCWKEYVTYRIRELGDSPGMTEAEYDAQNQHTLRRVEKDGDDWAAMGRVVPLRMHSSSITRTKRANTMHALTPFVHAPPIFLSAADERIFNLQPENTNAMRRDWVTPWQYKNCYDDGFDTYYAVLKGGEGWSFQHWFDNLYPQIWQIYKEAKHVTAVIEHPRDKILYELWARLGFTADRLRESIPQGHEMKTCVFPSNSQIRAHPDMIRDLRALYMPDVQVNRKVVWIHRSKSTSHNGGRFATNENDLILALQQLGFDVESFEGTDNLEEAISTFSDAFAVVGVHGGGLYNQYFASTQTKIIELMPVAASGLLHSQRNAQSVPKLAHRCIWQNANLIGQPYVRIHVTTPSIQQLEIPVDRVLQALAYGSAETTPESRLCDQIRAHAAEMVEDDGFVPTGDIDDMWIRDSAAQVHPLLDSHPELVRKVIEKQAFYIEFDPYANSYGRTFREPSILGRHGWVTTRNYELDSGAYFIRLVHAYWKRTGETLGAAAIKKLLHVWRVEQHHAHSLYRYDELQGGVGTPVGYTGMTWTGFRPSDDKCTYHYHIPDNVFAAVALGYVEEMGFEVGTLRDDIVQGIHMFGVHDGIYCYEVDGLGNCNKMDDANLPSLLSLPYLDPDQTVYDRAVWERTRAFVLSDANPYYYVGKYRGVGSPHTPPDHVWHLSLIVQAMQGDSEAWKTLEETASVPGLKASAFHESFHVDNPAKYTRKWFAWADALYLELCH